LTTEAADAPVAQSDETEVKEPVTDVVPEQIGSGEGEPAPTPAVGEAKKEEVTEEGGLEKVDEDLEDLKVEEKNETSDREVAGEATSESAEVVGAGGDPTSQVSEETSTPVPADEKEEEGSVAESSVPVATAPAPEPRKQERVENPTYTLEITGTKYNPSNFW
jgi:hypothetical protein